MTREKKLPPCVEPFRVLSALLAKIRDVTHFCASGSPTGFRWRRESTADGSFPGISLATCYLERFEAAFGTGRCGSCQFSAEAFAAVWNPIRLSCRRPSSVCWFCYFRSLFPTSVSFSSGRRCWLWALSLSKSSLKCYSDHITCRTGCCLRCELQLARYFAQVGGVFLFSAFVDAPFLPSPSTELAEA